MPRWPRGNRPRGGRRNRDEQSGQWNAQEKTRPPPGLRGKAIGLFYRDLHKNRPKKDRHTMRLSIPPAVIRQVGSRLESIRKIAKQQKIDLSYVTQMKRIKLEIKTEPVETQPYKSISTSNFDSPSSSKSESNTIIKVEDSSSDSDEQTELKFKKPLKIDTKPTVDNKDTSVPVPDFAPFKTNPSTSSTPDFIPTKQENLEHGTESRLLSLRGGGDFKYGYKDIITGSFNDKLEQCLAKGVAISQSTREMKELNESLYHNYVEMLERKQYKKMLQFREKLPTYKKSCDLLDVISNSSVVVISGETGCGKSTQVPQLILDDAIINQRGANTRIIVTQPRRIAASSLAERVAEERAERMGQSVGYAVRLERVESRQRGSIMYFTTGILLSELEVNQGLTNVSHVILDEVHERDVHVDLSMVVLKQILKKRKDLKVILMSATLDAASLSAYFDNCPMLHIEGLAYPVKDVYLEEIIKLTGFQFDSADNQRGRNADKKKMELEIKHRAEVYPWLETIKRTLDRDVYRALMDYRSEEISIELIVDVISYICRGEPGAILVFLPGIADITKLLGTLEQGNFRKPKFEIYPLHSKLPSLEQKKIFERPPDGVRKIIIATNIAETSITIDDIVYVIDCGKIKMKGLIVEENLATLQTEWVSQANLRQRRGRAGRCQPGVCYHLISSFRASKLDERLQPELRRSNLLEPVLMIKQLRLGKAAEALSMVPDPPAEATVTWAVKHLQQLGALDECETLTPLGWHLARLPVHPAAGKLLLLGALFGCLDRAASVAAVWGFKDPFMLVIGKEDQANSMKRELAQGEPSDHVAISEALMRWENAGRNSRSFAFDYFLSNNTLQMLSEMKRQFGGNLKSMGFLTSGDVRSSWENRNSTNMSLFKAIVAASLYPNVGNVRWITPNNINKPARIIVRTPEDGRVEIHPSSIMATSYRQPRQVALCTNPGANWLVYWLKQKSSKLFLLELTLVYTLPLLFFGELRVTHEDEHPDDCFIGISTTQVKCKRETAELLFELRALLDHVLANKVMVSSERGVKDSAFEKQVLDAVIELITAEDEQADYGNDTFDDSDRESDHEHNQRNWRR